MKLRGTGGHQSDDEGQKGTGPDTFDRDFLRKITALEVDRQLGHELCRLENNLANGQMKPLDPPIRSWVGWWVSGTEFYPRILIPNEDVGNIIQAAVKLEAGKCTLREAAQPLRKLKLYELGGGTTLEDATNAGVMTFDGLETRAESFNVKGLSLQRVLLAALVLQDDEKTRAVSGTELIRAGLVAGLSIVIPGTLIGGTMGAAGILLNTYSLTQSALQIEFYTLLAGGLPYAAGMIFGMGMESSSKLAESVGNNRLLKYAKEVYLQIKRALTGKPSSWHDKAIDDLAAIKG